MKRMVVFTDDEWDAMRSAAANQVADWIFKRLIRSPKYEDVVYIVDQAIRQCSGDER